MRRLLGNWLDAWNEYVQYTETPQLFKTWAGLFTICAVTSRKVYQKYGMVKFPMNLWVLLVAPPGRCRKSSILEPVRWFLSNIPDVYLASEMSTAEAMIEQFLQAYNIACEKIRLPQLQENTATSAVNVVSSEFGVFLNDNTKFLSLLTDLYDCPDEWSYTTIGRSTRIIRKAWLSILGATTPEALSNALPKTANEGGFLSRFIIAFAARADRYIPLTSMPEEDKGLRDMLLKDLYVISQIDGLITMDRDAKSIYESWYNEHVQKDWGTAFLQHYSSRKPRHLLTVAGLFSLARTTSKTITKDDLLAAMDLLDITEGTVFKWNSESGEEPYASCRGKIISHLTINGGKMAREKLLRVVGSAYSNETIEKAINNMIASEEVTIETKNGVVYLCLR